MFDLKYNFIHYDFFVKNLTLENTTDVMYWKLCEFDRWYTDDKIMINKNIDFVLYLMSKNIFLCFVRNTLVHMRNKKLITQTIYIDFEQSKQSILHQCVCGIESFLVYFIVCLYCNI